VLGRFRELIAAVGAALHEAGLPLVGDARHGIFRIYRDVRFSRTSGCTRRMPGRC
jgi:uncharacterized protein (DUF2461 family)